MNGDIIHFLKEFHENEVLPRGTNFIFHYSDTKGGGSLSLGEYRPISLVRCMKKILAKIITRRMAKVLPKMIDSRQSAFLGVDFNILKKIR